MSVIFAILAFMNTAELNPTVQQAAVNAEFDQIVAGLDMAPVYNFNIPEGVSNLSEKGFKAAGEMGNVAVNSEVQFEGAVDYMRSIEEMAAIARKSSMLYDEVSGLNAARATEQMARVGAAEGDEEDER